SIDWRHYFANVHLPGLKRNVLNLTDDNVGQGNGSKSGRPKKSAPALEKARKVVTDDEEDEEEPPVPLHQATGVLHNPHHPPAVSEKREGGERVSSDGDCSTAGPGSNGKPGDHSEPANTGRERWGRVLASKPVVDDSHWLEASLSKNVARATM